MPFTAHNPRPFFDAIAARLVASTGRTIGRSEAPAVVTVPYAVVYPLDEDDTDTTLDDPFDVTLFRWSVVSVGDSEEQALWMVHKVRVALVGWQPVVAGLTCGFVFRDGGRGVSREDPTQPPKFSGADVFTVFAD